MIMQVVEKPVAGVMGMAEFGLPMAPKLLRGLG